MPSLFDLRLILLSGKGGVGRTTVAAALARAAAARGKRVLITQTDAVERLGKMLGRPGPIGPTVVTVSPGIDAVNMTPRASLHQYALLVLKYEAVYRAIFENRAVRGFLAAVPGLDAYAMLGKAWWHTTEMDPGRRALKYDLVILDGPASGHAIAMLRIPRGIVEAIPAGPIARDARLLVELLADPARTAFVNVTRPEELPAQETLELTRAARSELGVALGPVIVNAVPPARLSAPAVASVLDHLTAPTGDARWDATLKMAAGVQAHHQTAEAIMAALRRAPGLPLVPLPWLPSTDPGPREIDVLSTLLGAAPALNGAP